MGYDASPFKVRPCDKDLLSCLNPYPRIRSSELPDPGVALPSGVDHWHILPRGGGDNRGARDIMRWRTIALSTVRCEHGRLQGDICTRCPNSVSPNKSGTRIGTAHDGTPVVAPPREEHTDPSAWFKR